MLLKAWELFSKRTTIHGVPDIKNAHSLQWRIFWILAVVLCSVCAGFEIYFVFKHYNQKPVITSFETRMLDKINFPLVSICLPHLINSSRVAELRIAPSVIDGFVSSSPASMSMQYLLPTIYGPVDMKTPLLQVQMLLLSPNKSAAQALIEGQNISLRMLERAEFELRQLFPDAGPESDLFELHYSGIKTLLDKNGAIEGQLLLSSVGFNLNETLRLCYFSKMLDCFKIVDAVYDVKWQRCFLVDVGQPQLIGGMGLMLVVQGHTKLAWKTAPSLDSGVMVQIYHEYSPLANSFLGVETGSYVQIQMQPTHYLMNKNRERGTCNDDGQLKYFNLPYSDTVCSMDCSADLYIEKCGCLTETFTKLLKNESLLPICSSGADLACFGTIDIAKSNSCMQTCKPKCDIWQYNPSLSYTKMPSPALSQLLKSQGIDPIVLDDLVYLNIIFGELTYMHIWQEDALTFDGFVSQIGGQLGLFLGASIISIIQTFIYILPSLCGKVKPKPQVNNQQM